MTVDELVDMLEALTSDLSVRNLFEDPANRTIIDQLQDHQIAVLVRFLAGERVEMLVPRQYARTGGERYLAARTSVLLDDLDDDLEGPAPAVKAGRRVSPDELVLDTPEFEGVTLP